LLSGMLDVPATGFLTVSHPDGNAAVPITTAAAESFRNVRRETCRKGTGGLEVVWWMTVVYARRIMVYVPYRMSWQSVTKLLNIVPSTVSNATCLSQFSYQFFKKRVFHIEIGGKTRHIKPCSCASFQQGGIESDIS
jgi:hypothetical protein